MLPELWNPAALDSNRPNIYYDMHSTPLHSYHRRQSSEFVAMFYACLPTSHTSK